MRAPGRGASSIRGSKRVTGRSGQASRGMVHRPGTVALAVRRPAVAGRQHDRASRHPGPRAATDAPTHRRRAARHVRLGIRGLRLGRCAQPPRRLRGGVDRAAERGVRRLLSRVRLGHLRPRCRDRPADRDRRRRQRRRVRRDDARHALGDLRAGTLRQRDPRRDQRRERACRHVPRPVPAAADRGRPGRRRDRRGTAARGAGPARLAVRDDERAGAHGDGGREPAPGAEPDRALRARAFRSCWSTRAAAG